MAKVAPHPRLLSMLGNMHPEIAILMERVFLFTAKRVQPHSALPEGYVLPDGGDPWAWIQLDPELADLCGLRDCLSDPEVAERLALTRTIVPNPDEMHLPDAEGYKILLPGGVESQIHETVAQIRVGNRDFPFPPAHCLSAASRRVLSSFGTPNQRLVLSQEALETARSIGTQNQVSSVGDRGLETSAGQSTRGRATWYGELSFDSLSAVTRR